MNQTLTNYKCSDNCQPRLIRRTSSLDVLKCFAAFFVVCLHYLGGGKISPLIRCAVPLFFMITGYYYPNMIKGGSFWKHMQKLVTMTVFATLFYGLLEFQHVWRHGMFNEWLCSTFRLRHIVGIIIFDNSIWGFHLWYFYAIIYDLLILYCADKLHLANRLKYATAVLFCVFCIINVTPISDRYCLTRNFLFMGLPCIMAGRWVKEQNEYFTKFFSSSRIWWTVFVGSFILTIVEMLILRWLNIGNRMGIREMYIFTIPFLLSVFYWALQHPFFGEGSILATIGRKYSAYIYIFHPIVGILICHFLHVEGRFERLLLTLAIFIGSLLWSWIFCITKDKMKNFSIVVSKNS